MTTDKPGYVKYATCPETITCMTEYQGCIFVGAGNKVYKKLPDSDDFVQMSFYTTEPPQEGAV